MGKVKGKHRLDKYYRLAKEHGYRSRAAWKLVQIDAKFTVLRSSRAVLDLCAAPGGWMQAAVERVPVGSLIIGIDLVPIAPIRGAISIEEDITKSECRSKIKRLMSQHGTRAFDLILHDGSPNVGGAWASEAMSQNALVIDSVRLATQFLAPKGNFISKVFRSQDYSSVLYCIKQLFEKVEVYKPPASRSTSAEIYILGLKYKAPAKIDPRLLDVKHLFQGVIEPRKVVDVLRGDKQKRHRDGYEDGDTILRKVCSAADFVWSETPLEILGTVTSISFEDPACLPLKDHTLTTEEVKILCDDLRVLGKQDFKYLLKWRMQIRKALSPTQKATPATTDVDSVVKLDEDEKLLNEMEELTYAMDRKKKREKKIAAKRREKDKMRKATGGMQVDATEDSYTDHELFSLSSIKGKKDLAVVDSTEGDYDDGSLADSENEETHEEPEDQSDIDSDEERKRYDDEVEQILDQAYERFAAKQGGSAMQRKRTRLAYSEDGKHLDNEDDDTINSDPDLDDEVVRVEANPLMVSLEDHVAPTQDELTRRWFNQDIFSEAVVEGDLEENASEDEMEIDAAKKKPENQELKSSKAGNDFEIVPAPETDSSDSSSSDEDDVQTKAEVLACAKKMLRKKTRETLFDDAYNKYMHDDDSFLPKWFLEDEKRHWRPTKQVTKEEIAAERAQFKLIDARPAKKVAEAKARKKRVAARKLDKVRKKANTISDQVDISDLSKRKMIDQLYKKAMPKKPQKEYVVAKKGVQVRTGKGKVLVDRRMKKDSRGNKQGKGGKKGKNGKGQKSGNKGSAKKGKMEGGAGGGYKGRKTKKK